MVRAKTAPKCARARARGVQKIAGRCGRIMLTHSLTRSFFIFIQGPIVTRYSLRVWTTLLFMSSNGVATRDFTRKLS